MFQLRSWHSSYPAPSSLPISCKGAVVAVVDIVDRAREKRKLFEEALWRSQPEERPARRLVRFNWKITEYCVSPYVITTSVGTQCNSCLWLKELQDTDSLWGGEYSVKQRSREGRGDINKDTGRIWSSGTCNYISQININILKGHIPQFLLPGTCETLNRTLQCDKR